MHNQSLSVSLDIQGETVPTLSVPDEPQRTKRQAISAEPTGLDPSKLTDVTLTSYRKTKE